MRTNGDEDALFRLYWNTPRTLVTRSIPCIAVTVIRTRTSHDTLSSALAIVSVWFVLYLRAASWGHDDTMHLRAIAE